MTDNFYSYYILKMLKGIKSRPPIKIKFNKGQNNTTVNNNHPYHHLIINSLNFIVQTKKKIINKVNNRFLNKYQFILHIFLTMKKPKTCIITKTKIIK